MRIDLAKWELGILLDSQLKLAELNRELDYDDRKRVSILRDFLDSQVEPGILLEAQESPIPETKDNEVAF